MQKRFVLAVLVLLLTLGVSASPPESPERLASGSGASLITEPLQDESMAIDIVNGQQPVSRAMSGTRLTVSALAALDPDRREAQLRQDWPVLEREAIRYLQGLKKLPVEIPEITVALWYGSKKNVRGESGDGQWRRGYFTGQVVMALHMPGFDTEYRMLDCLNSIEQSEVPSSELARLDTVDLQSLGSRTLVTQDGRLVYAEQKQARLMIPRTNQLAILDESSGSWDRLWLARLPEHVRIPTLKFRILSR